jgi:glycosyltransferase involved in cell wall biosynthesis
MTVGDSVNPLGRVTGTRARRLRVLHLIDHMGVGGAQRLVLDLAEARGAGIDMAIASLRSHCLTEAANRMEKAGVRYTGLGITRGNPFSIHRLWPLIRRWQPDIIHSHLEASSTLVVFAALPRGGSRPHLVNHLHNDPRQQYSAGYRLAGWLLAPHFDAHVVPTATLAMSAAKAFGKRHRHMEIIPYGIDPAWLDKGPSRQGAVLRGGAKRLIGTVGRLVPQKSTRTLLQAAPQLLAAEPSTRFVVVGDGPLLHELQAQARDLGIEESVRFLGYCDDLVSIYSALDVFVLPSRYEGFPISLLEAMAMGAPVVATNVIGISDALENGSNGLLVPYDSPGDLADAVLRLLSDNSLRNTLRSNARNRIRDCYTRDKFAARMESFYRRLCRDPAVQTQDEA